MDDIAKKYMQEIQQKEDEVIVEKLHSLMKEEIDLESFKTFIKDCFVKWQNKHTRSLIIEKYSSTNFFDSVNGGFQINIYAITGTEKDAMKIILGTTQKTEVFLINKKHFTKFINQTFYKWKRGNKND